MLDGGLIAFRVDEVPFGQAEVKREEEAAYARLTGLVSDALTSVQAAAQALAVADVRAATARLATAV